MSIAVAIALVIVALTFVLFPLYQHWRLQHVISGELTGQETDELIEQEQGARQALQEVEFDYQLGNMDKTDYQVLHERYMQRAVTALKARHEQEQEIDNEIEEQLRRMREAENGSEELENHDGSEEKLQTIKEEGDTDAKSEKHNTDN